MRRRDLAPIPLRVVLGVGFLVHGIPKLGPKFDVMVQTIEGMGFPYPAAWTWLVAILEVVGGAALLLGVATTLFAGLLIVDMLVAMFGVHWSAGYNYIQIIGATEAGPTFGFPGIEGNLLYIAGLAALVLSGPGIGSLGSTRPSDEEPGS